NATALGPGHRRPDGEAGLCRRDGPLDFDRSGLLDAAEGFARGRIDVGERLAGLARDVAAGDVALVREAEVHQTPKLLVAALDRLRRARRHLRNERELLGVSEGLNGQIDVQGRPVQVMRRRQLDVDELTDGRVTKPWKIVERDEQLFDAEKNPE